MWMEANIKDLLLQMEAARENLNTWLGFDDKLFMVIGFLVRLLQLRSATFAGISHESLSCRRSLYSFTMLSFLLIIYML